MKLKSFDNFIEEKEVSLFTMGEAVNEGLFDKLSSMFAKFPTLFKDKEKLTKSVEATVTEAGDTGKKFIPKSVKENETYIVVMGDGKSAATDFSIAFTKLADLPDGSGLFQISGTTSPEMLKALVGSDKIEDLAKNNVMAMISPTGLEKGKVATMRILKNVMPGGKDYVTKSVMVGAVPQTAVDKTLAKVK